MKPHLVCMYFGEFMKSNTVFPHIVAAATIRFWIHLVRKLFKFSFPLCNENLNSFLTRWGNYSRVETIWGNTVYEKKTSEEEHNSYKIPQLIKFYLYKHNRKVNIVMTSDIWRSRDGEPLCYVVILKEM